MKDRSVGDILRDARVAKGLQLSDLEVLTSIPTHHLLALELDQFSLIPDGLAEEYLGRYAEQVELNVDDIKQQREEQDIFQHTLPLASNNQPVIKPAFSDDYEEQDEEIKPVVKRESSVAASNRRRRSHREVSQKKAPWFAIIVSILAFAIVCLVAYFLIQEWPLNLGGFGNGAKSGEETTVVETTTVSEMTETVATTVTNEFANGQLTTIAKSTKDTVELVITLIGTESWVAVGEQSTTLTEAQKELKVSLNKGSSSFVTLGIPQGVEVTVDGQKVDLTDIVNNSPGNLTLRVE